MRPSAVAEWRPLVVAPRRATKNVPTRRARAPSLRLKHEATSPSSSMSSTSTSSSSVPPPPPPPLSSPFLPFGSTAVRSQNQAQNGGGKIVWVQPFTAEVAQAASEAGVRVLLFDEADAARAADFGTLARFDAVVRFDDGLLADVTGRSVGVAVELRTPADVRRAEELAAGPFSSPSSSSKSDGNSSSSSSSSTAVVESDSDDSESVVLADARDWAIIPAENLVAAFQEARRRTQASWEASVRRGRRKSAHEGGGGGGGGEDEKNTLPPPPLPKRPRRTPRLLVTASTADGALALLGALEAGVDGVVLRTGDPREVRALCTAVEAAAAEAAVRSKAMLASSSSSSSSALAGEKNSTNDGNDTHIDFEVGVVSSVSPAGMGDRVCVDVTVLLEPGEGLLVGSFAAAALLVHSEREGAQTSGKGSSEEAYISPRPFRVNAGAVHSYVAVPRGRTAYLSELEAGSEVLVVRPPMTVNGDACGGGPTSTTTATTSTAVVGRAKVERRPMIKVDVRLADGSTCSAVLQNAETVRVVAPKSSSTTTAATGRGSVSTTTAGATAARSPRRRRLGAEDEEALRWAMDPSPPAAAASSASSSTSPREKLAVDAERTLEWVMGPSASAASSFPLPSSSSSPALTATPTWSSTSSSSLDSSEGAFEDSDGAEEELVEGPPHRPYLLPRRHDSRAAAALRWLLNGGSGGKKASSSSSNSSSSPLNSAAPGSPSLSPASAFPSSTWDPRETEGWTTVAVTDLVPGQPLLVRRAAAARHTGIEIEESIVER